MALIGTSTAFSQEEPATEEEESDIATLNPFVIEEEEGTWSATQTLAGSRLKTDLTDVASQVEVMTMDFMEAFQLNSIEEAAIYSLNVESPQENTGDGISGAGNEQLRVRGISNATRSREFFATSIPTDNYNLSRVSISSGPNAILFGTGSPAGAIDSTLLRALTNDTFGEARLQIDDWGGYRAQIDYNLAINDQFAVRAAALTHKRAFDEDEAFIQNDRFYVTGTWKPFKRTTISAHAELIDIENRRPTRTAPYDHISSWFLSDDILTASGSVDADNPTIPNGSIFDNSLAWQDNGRSLPGNQNAIWDTGGNNVTILGGNQGGRLNTPRSWWGSVHSPVLAPNGDFTLFEGVNRDSNGTTLLNDDYLDRDFHTINNLVAQNDDATLLNLFINQEIVDNLFFDFGYYYEKNDDFNPASLQFTQGYIVEVDSNRYLPGGVGGTELNPLAGQLYVDGSPEFLRGYSENSEWRAALSYEFDVRDWTDNRMIGWLGRHRLAGMYLDRRQETMSQLFKYHMQPQMINGEFRDGNWEGYPYNDLDTRFAVGGLGVPGVQGDTQSEAYRADGRSLTIRSYLGAPGSITYPELPLNFVPGEAFSMTDRDGNVFVLDPENAYLGTNGEQLSIGNAANGTKNFLKTLQFSWQGFWWNDRIVTTFGWREDTLNSAEEDTGFLTTEWMHPETGVVSAASDVRLRDHYDNVPFEAYDDSLEATGRTKLTGFVVHPFRNWDGFSLPFNSDISFSYNKSDTFQPNTNERSADGNLIPGEEGEGEDYGVRISMFDRRFNLRYNYYETIAGPTKLFLPFRRWRFRWREGGSMRDTIVMLAGADKQIFDSIFPNPEDWPLRGTWPGVDATNMYPFDARDGGFETGDFDNYGDPYTFTATSEAEGHEVSISWEPTRNLSLRATWNDQQVTQSDLGADWFQFTEEYQAIMDRTQFVEGYVPGITGLSGFDDPNGTDLDGLDLDPNDGLAPGIDYFTWDQIPYGGNNNGRQMVSQPWGQNDDAVAGGWTRSTMKERHFERVVNSNNGTTILKAFDGQPNDFLRNNRMNINAQYRFTEGRLNGLRLGGALRWRKGAGIGVGTQIINGEEVPDTDVIIKGPDSTFVDLSFDYRSRGDLFGFLPDGYRYNIGLTVRNIFGEGPYEPELVDANTGETTNYLRVDGRQFLLSAGLEF